MPSIRQPVNATTTNALQGVKFAVIPPGGAVLNMWAASATNGDSFGLSIGNQDIVVQGTEMNVEASADVIDTDRDQVVFNEVVPGGELFLPVTLTTEAQFLIHIRYL